MNDVIWVALIAGGASILGSVGTIWVGLNNGRKADSLHVLINSGLTRQINESVRAAIAEGRAEGMLNGIAQERASLDAEALRKTTTAENRPQ